MFSEAWGAHTTKMVALERSRRDISIDTWLGVCTLPVDDKTSFRGGCFSCVLYGIQRDMVISICVLQLLLLWARHSSLGVPICLFIGRRSPFLTSTCLAGGGNPSFTIFSIMREGYSPNILINDLPSTLPAIGTHTIVHSFSAVTVLKRPSPLM